MTKRIFRSICIVAIAVFLLSMALIMGMLYDYFTDLQMEQLATHTELVVRGVEDDGLEYLLSLDTENLRITLIDVDGSVIYDSMADSSEMENHLEREEIVQALQNGEGSSSRYSTTLLKRQLYCARKLDSGMILRLSSSQYTWWTLLPGMVRPIIMVIIIAVALSLLLAFRLSKSIVHPLDDLDLDDSASDSVYEELSPLLNRINSQQRQLKRQAAELSRKKNEFDAATRNMSEGLVLLSDKGVILSINNSASLLLGISPDCVGEEILSLNDSAEMQDILRKARAGEHTETTIPIDGSDYQINASPVISGDTLSGIALLIFDITDKEKAEQIRREFTANVSHELKTPLQSISGCAELLSGGMVRQEDVPKFSQQIFTESKRMISLVDDIIRLSHLDEGAQDMQREEVDLYELAALTVGNLTPIAQGAEVSLELRGEAAPMTGIKQLLSGIVFNLCDNAIKYNRRRGRVVIEVKTLPDGITLSVSDTGIGIPDELQERIFERFFRVDKSHSKEVGGTGLGLSIVKHAAKLHDAEIDLHSVLGEGTTVKVVFPR